MDINEILQNTPALLSRKSEQAEEHRLRWQQAKEIYNNIEASYVLIALKESNPNIKTSEIKYHINHDDRLYKERLNILLLESNYRKAEVDVKALEEELRACKMLARIRISEWESQIEFKDRKKEG